MENNVLKIKYYYIRYNRLKINQFLFFNIYFCYNIYILSFHKIKQDNCCLRENYAKLFELFVELEQNSFFLHLNMF